VTSFIDDPYVDRKAVKEYA